MNEENHFDVNRLIIHQHDRVWFDSTSIESLSIVEKDSSTDRLPLVKAFPHLGLFSFVTSKSGSSSSSSLTIVVLPPIRFHWKLIRLSDFDAQAIRTVVNDFIIWQFEQVIRFNMIQLRSNETLQDLIACHERASTSRNRQCIAVECIMPGIFYFANPGNKDISSTKQEFVFRIRTSDGIRTGKREKERKRDGFICVC